MIDGIGKGAEIVVNNNGGKQSKCIGRFDLIDPRFLTTIIPTKEMEAIYKRMINVINNQEMVLELAKLNKDIGIVIGKVLEEGIKRYPRNNWRLIPAEDHLNHALIHLYAHYLGDTQDDHYGHFLTRVMMFVSMDKDNYNFLKVENDER